MLLWSPPKARIWANWGNCSNGHKALKMRGQLMGVNPSILKTGPHPYPMQQTKGQVLSEVKELV